MNYIQIRELIYRHFENDLSPTEEETLKEQLEENPVARKEWESIRKIIEGTARMATVEPPQDFTSTIVGKLSPKSVSPWKKVTDFLFRPHTLRLNFVTEVCALVLIAAMGITLFVSGATLKGRQVPATAQGPAQPAVLTRFHIYLPEAESVYVAGSFNGWRKDQFEMIDLSGDGFWTITLPLPLGTHSYMFFADDVEWIADPSAERLEDDGFGNENSVIEVAGNYALRSL
jgi:hypothetical protein